MAENNKLLITEEILLQLGSMLGLQEVVLLSIRRLARSDSLQFTHEGSLSVSLQKKILKAGYVIGKNEGDKERRCFLDHKGIFTISWKHPSVKFGELNNQDKKGRKIPDLVVYNKVSTTSAPFIIELKCYPLIGSKSQESFKYFDNDLQKIKNQTAHLFAFVMPKRKYQGLIKRHKELFPTFDKLCEVFRTFRGKFKENYMKVRLCATEDDQGRFYVIGGVMIY